MEILGKRIEELTPEELAKFSSDLSAQAAEIARITADITARQAVIKAEGEKTVFAELASVAKTYMITRLSWAKLPALNLRPTLDGTEYVVSHHTELIPTGVKKSRKKKDANGNGNGNTPPKDGVTVTKIIDSFGGGIGKDTDDGSFEVGGKQVKTLKALMGLLVNPVTKGPESDVCWDTSGKGYAASTIALDGRSKVKTSHKNEITLVFPPDSSGKVTRLSLAEAEKMYIGGKAAVAVM